jgi:hypothetical protein
VEEWRKGYLRAVLDFIGAPDDVDLETVTITTDWEEAGGYSEYTNWDASINMGISYVTPEDLPYPPNYHRTGVRVARGESVHTGLTNDEVAALIRSF